MENTANSHLIQPFLMIRVTVKVRACKSLYQTSVGYGSCNAYSVCMDCPRSIVPNNACNALDGIDTTDENCNYCMVSSMEKKYKCLFGFWYPSGLLLLSILTYFSYHYLLLSDRALILVQKLFLNSMNLIKN